jgi:hypothetical protein
MKLQIPTKLDEVTIGTFIKIAKLEQPQDAEGQLDHNIKVLSLLTGEPEDVFLELTPAQLSHIISKITFLKNLPEAKAVNTIKLNGKTYKANLLVTELTAGQYIDLSEFIKSPINNLHKIMATLYLPCKKTWYGKWVVEKYNGKTHKDRADEFYRYMPVSVAYPASVFFYQISKGLTTNIETYFINKGMEELERAAKLLRVQSGNSKSVGGGIQRWIVSQITALKSGKHLQN